MDIMDLSDRINDLQLDLKAEFLVSQLLPEGLVEQEIICHNKSSFKRRWSREIDHSGVELLENGEIAINLQLNRDGIYDGLPEEIFHKPPESASREIGDEENVTMHLRKEEKAARHFFRPIENELFISRVRLAHSENRILGLLNLERIESIIPHFWKLDEVAADYTQKLRKLLPLASEIIGNYQLLTEALQFLINEEVSVSYYVKKVDTPDEEEESQKILLGQCNLGHDTFLGNYSYGFQGIVVVNIGPLHNSMPDEYFEKGKKKQLLTCFYNFFLPMEVDVETRLRFERDAECLMLSNIGDGTMKSFLGINSVLM